MRNLYLRIFLSFWVAMVLAQSFTVGATLWLAGQRIQHVQARQDALASQASSVLAAQGVSGLRQWLARESARVAPDRLFVLDQHGNDLMGRSVPEYLQQQAGHRPIPRTSTGTGRDIRLLSQLVSPSNQTYALSLLYHLQWPFGIFGSAESALVALIATLLVSTIVCFLLARYLSDPVRHLRAATRSIAAGDLGVRVSSLVGKRRDELALLAVDFDAMAERLRVLLESQRQLLRDVSHELRSPLARLQIALALARRPNAKLEQEFDRIEHETQRLDELIGEILSLSRLEDPARALSTEAVNLSELLETLAENARIEAEPRGVQVKLHCPQDLSVEGDRELLFRALENIVRNAVNFSPHGAAVELTARQSGQQALIQITDRGPGVPADLLERIFEPFFRIGKGHEQDSDGHGIGLAITARVAALHGGSVRAHNAPDAGLQVDFVLPLRQSAAHPNEPSSRAIAQGPRPDALEGAGAQTPARAPART